MPASSSSSTSCQRLGWREPGALVWASSSTRTMAGWRARARVEVELAELDAAVLDLARRAASPGPRAGPRSRGGRGSRRSRRRRRRPRPRCRGRPRAWRRSCRRRPTCRRRSSACRALAGAPRSAARPAGRRDLGASSPACPSARRFAAGDGYWRVQRQVQLQHVHARLAEQAEAAVRSVCCGHQAPHRRPSTGRAPGHARHLVLGRRRADVRDPARCPRR